MVRSSPSSGRRPGRSAWSVCRRRGAWVLGFKVQFKQDTDDTEEAGMKRIRTNQFFLILFIPASSVSSVSRPVVPHRRRSGEGYNTATSPPGPPHGRLPPLRRPHAGRQVPRRAIRRAGPEARCRRSRRSREAGGRFAVGGGRVRDGVRGASRVRASPGAPSRDLRRAARHHSGVHRQQGVRERVEGGHAGGAEHQGGGRERGGGRRDGEHESRTVPAAERAGGLQVRRPDGEGRARARRPLVRVRELADGRGGGTHRQQVRGEQGGPGSVQRAEPPASGGGVGERGRLRTRSFP